VSADEPLESEAEELFAQWLESRDRGRPVELESLAGGREDLLEALRGLEAFWSQLEAAGGLDAAFEGSRDANANASAASGGRPVAPGEVTPASERYRVEREVGRGGMGVVFEVEDEHLHRRLAMKVVRAAPGAAGDRALTRFLDEAQVTAQLEHPAIVPVHELGRDDEGRAYFTMALVEGRTLSQVIDALHDDGDEEWTLPRVLDAVAKAAEAVAYAHSRGVVHRDLKPDNVMVGSFGRVFVMDWGLAQVKSKRASEVEADGRANGRAPEALETDQPFLTHDGDVVGTPAYMPPEQAFGQLDRQGPRCDVYALGAILYHVVGGRAPYADRSEGTLAALRHGAPTPLLALDPRHSRELVAIIELAMRRDASKRYADVGALVADLRAFLEGRVVDAYESGALAQARKWVLRHRALAALAAGLLVALALFGVSDYARSEKERLAGRFMDLERLDDLEASADDLWPAAPARIDDLERFVARAREHASLLPAVRDELDGLAPANDAVGAEAWILDKRRELARRLAAFADPDAGPLAAVERRLERARLTAAIVERASVTADATDARALARGLLPLAPHPSPSGPRRRYESLATASLERLSALAEARAEVPDTLAHRGVVLVELVPSDFDLLATYGPFVRNEAFSGLAARDVEPVLVATCELTRDQWRRLAEDDARGERPMVGVSFLRALEVLPRGGFTLPTKYQWLAAARAGSPGDWWFELDPAWFDGDAALDADAVEAAFLEREVFSGRDERLDEPSPVASRRPNALGLYDVMGNVSELLLDPFHRTQEPVLDYDPEAWTRVRGYTRSTSFASFQLRPAVDGEREFMTLGTAGEIGEASADPYTGVRVVAPLP